MGCRGWILNEVGVREGTYFPLQQLRKLVLELIHRLPANDHLKGHVKVSKDVEEWLSTFIPLYEIQVAIFMVLKLELY